MDVFQSLFGFPVLYVVGFKMNNSASTIRADNNWRFIAFRILPIRPRTRVSHPADMRPVYWLSADLSVVTRLHSL